MRTGWLSGFALATVIAMLDAAPTLADRRPTVMYVAKQAPRGTEELPLPVVPTADDVVALYRAVGRDLRDLARRDRDASNDLMPRFRYIKILDAVGDAKKRRVAARTLVELRQLIAMHAN